jgi:hypothetical protein
MSVGGSVVEPIVAELINERTLIDLLTKGNTGEGSRYNVKVPAGLVPFSPAALRGGWQVWWASEYGLGDYYLLLPPANSPDEQFIVRRSLKDWQWKLSGSELPQPMRVELAQEIVKQHKEKKEE